MNDSDRKRILELKQLCEKASEGPWFTPYNGTLLLSVASDSQKICICIPPADINHKTIDNNNNNNFEFIAESRTSIPFLIELVEKQEKQIAVMREALEDLGFYWCGACSDNQKIRDNALAEVDKLEKENE